MYPKPNHNSEQIFFWMLPELKIQMQLKTLKMADQLPYPIKHHTIKETTNESKAADPI